MTIYAPDYAGAVVFRFVDTLNKMLHDSPSSAAAREGSRRRRIREANQAKAMKKWHASATKALDKMPPSRQVKRRMARQAVGSKIAHLKSETMRQSLPGGSAATR